MKRFENGDVLLTKDEFERISTRDGKRETWEFINYLIRHSQFYYKLKELIYLGLPAINLASDPRAPTYEDFYRISKRDYELFRALMKCINEFEPDRPV